MDNHYGIVRRDVEVLLVCNHEVVGFLLDLYVCKVICNAGGVVIGLGSADAVTGAGFGGDIVGVGENTIYNTIV